MAHLPTSSRLHNREILAAQLFRVEPLILHLDSNLRCSFVSRYKGTHRANNCFATAKLHRIKYRLDLPRKVIFQPTDQPRENHL